jgi:DNA-binding protein HU-beta
MKVLYRLYRIPQESLTQGEPIYIRTFGSFTLKRRAPKVARNIGQNTALPVAAHLIPSFKPSPEFKNQVKAREMATEPKKARL